MQILHLTLLAGLFLSGCSLIKRKTTEDFATSNKLPTTRSAVLKQKKITSTARSGVWELLSPGKIQFQFKNVDNGSSLSVIIEEGLSKKNVPPGHWELTGFEQNGVSYLSMNTTKKFVLKKNVENHAYAGSVVVGCPKIAAGDLKLLKGLSFFNRYPFSSKIGLCEIVIGNNLIKVRAELGKAQKSKKLNMVLGF